ncbi:MAG: hypothetical protein WCI18_04340 [Pseudomonadota bacterium]
MFFDSAKDRQDLVKELFSAVLKSAGKGKNEVITVLGREMGMAFAAMVKDPLQKIVDSKALKVNFQIELVDKGNRTSGSKKTAPKKKTKR